MSTFVRQDWLVNNRVHIDSQPINIEWHKGTESKWGTWIGGAWWTVAHVSVMAFWHRQIGVRDGYRLIFNKAEEFGGLAIAWFSAKAKKVGGMVIAWFLTKAKRSKGWQLLDFKQRQRGQRDTGRGGKGMAMAWFLGGNEVDRIVITWFPTKADRLMGSRLPGFLQMLTGWQDCDCLVPYEGRKVGGIMFVWFWGWSKMCRCQKWPLAWCSSYEDGMSAGGWSGKQKRVSRANNTGAGLDSQMEGRWMWIWSVVGAPLKRWSSQNCVLSFRIEESKIQN